MSIYIQSIKLTGAIATLAAGLVLLAAPAGAGDRGPHAMTAVSSRVANSPPIIAKHGHDDHGDHDNHHGHGRKFRFSRLFDDRAYCDCRDEYCPEWIAIQCVPYQPRHVPVKRANAARAATAPISLFDPAYE